MHQRVHRRPQGEYITLTQLINTFQQLYHELDNTLFLLTEVYSQLSLYSPHSDLCQPDKLLGEITSFVTNIKDIQNQLFHSVKAKQNAIPPRLIYNPQSPATNLFNPDSNHSHQLPNIPIQPNTQNFPVGNLGPRENLGPRNFPPNYPHPNPHLSTTIVCENRSHIHQSTDDLTPFNQSSAFPLDDNFD